MLLTVLSLSFLYYWFICNILVSTWVWFPIFSPRTHIIFYKLVIDMSAKIIMTIFFEFHEELARIAIGICRCNSRLKVLHVLVFLQRLFCNISAKIVLGFWLYLFKKTPCDAPSSLQHIPPINTRKKFRIKFCERSITLLLYTHVFTHTYSIFTYMGRNRQPESLHPRRCHRYYHLKRSLL